MTEDQLSRIIIGACIDVHRTIGPGLFESTYEKCLAYELRKRGLRVETQKVLPLRYGEIVIDEGYRIDMLVENKVVIEIKSISQLLDVHWAQPLTYLRLGNFRLALLVNFNVVLMRDGIHRIVNGL